MGLKIIEPQIKNKLKTIYLPKTLEITNESDLHSGPRGRESHFKVLIVSDVFKTMKRIERQKHVFESLKEIMPQIHALSLRCLTPGEYDKTQNFQTPDCATKKSL